MKSNEIISIVIPAYNAESTIERCILSALNQDYSGIEVVVIDDGSSDNTVKIVEELKKSHKNIQLYSQMNAGVSSARNLGITKSIGEYLIFMDSDDYMMVDMCGKMVKNMNKGSDLVICGFDVVSNDRIVSTFLADEGYVSEIHSIQECFEMAYFKRVLNPPWNKLFKRKKIIEKFNTSKSSGEDLEFVLEYVKSNNKITFINERLYVNDISNERSLSKNYSIIFNNMIDNQMYLQDYVNKTDINIDMSNYFLLEIGSVCSRCYEKRVMSINNMFYLITNTKNINKYIDSLHPNKIRGKYIKNSILLKKKLLFEIYIKVLSLIHKIK